MVGWDGPPREGKGGSWSQDSRDIESLQLVGFGEDESQRWEKTADICLLLEFSGVSTIDGACPSVSELTYLLA